MFLSGKKFGCQGCRRIRMIRDSFTSDKQSTKTSLSWWKFVPGVFLCPELNCELLSALLPALVNPHRFARSTNFIRSEQIWMFKLSILCSLYLVKPRICTNVKLTKGLILIKHTFYYSLFTKEFVLIKCLLRLNNLV